MKKQKTQLLALLFVLLLLVAGWAGLKKYNQIQENAVAKDEGERIVDITSQEVTGFFYEKDGEEYAFEKQEEVWCAVANPEYSIDQSTISYILKNLVPFVAVETIENVTDMEQYGLTGEGMKFGISTETETYTFCVGDKNELAGAYYVCAPSDNTVYMVDSAVVNGFRYTWEDLIQEEESIETEENTKTTEIKE